MPGFAVLSIPFLPRACHEPDKPVRLSRFPGGSEIGIDLAISKRPAAPCPAAKGLRRDPERTRT